MSTSTISPTESQYPASLHNAEVSTNSSVANRTQSHSQKANVQTVGEPVCIDLDPTPSPSATVETDTQSIDVHKSTHPLVLKLPDTPSVTKHHVDFVRCEDVDTANAVKKWIEQQWSTLVKPGRAVKVKVKEELVSAVVETYISYQSYLLTVCTFTPQPRLTLD